jgi:CDP-diacylglycerol--glycerol-3-phosphate 3-phosphatidyltransferase
MKRDAKNKNTEMIFPCFEIESENILFLNEPQEYYEYLRKMFSGAKNRIIISSLYLGTGDLEKALVAEIEANLKRNENLSVKTLFDYSRGLRNKENSKTIFHECISQFPERFQLFLYHTPKLRGILKRLLPSRVDEIIGVMHIKVYIADNDLLITG